MQLKGESPDVSNLELNSDVITGGVEGQLAALNVYIDKCFHAYAALELFIKWYTKTNTRDFVKSIEFTENIDSMMEWEPDKKLLDKKIYEIKEKYRPENAYKIAKVSVTKKKS